MYRRLLVLAVVFASLPGGAFAAEKDRTSVFVDGLRKSPVFVSDSVPRRLSAADVAQLQRAVKAMPFPTYLVVAPLFTDEPGVEIGEDRLALLRDRLGKDGLYIVTDDRATFIDIGAYGVTPKVRAHDIELEAYYDIDRKRRTVDRLDYILALARGEPRLPRAQRAVIPPSEGGPEPTPYQEDDQDEDAGGVNLGALAMFVVGVGLSAGGLETRRRRRLGRGRLRPSSMPERDIRARAQTAVQRLATAIDKAPSPPERALDLAAAASMALDRKGKPIDDLGALVLALRGREALKGAEKERCFFDPRHQGPITQTRWQGGKATITVPACRRCAKAIEEGKLPPGVFDGDRPYWQRDTVWARTGFGALEHDMRRALVESRR